MTDLSPRQLREAALAKIDALLAASPDITEAQFTRASLLAELGRREEAKDAYLALLARVPTHFGALNNLGNLLYSMNFKTAARTVYLQAIRHHPDNPKGHVNLANLLAMNNEIELAIKHFETALRLDPDHMEANRGLAYILTEARDEARAAPYRQKAFRDRPLLVLPFCGDGTPVRVLLLLSALGGIIPMHHHFDDRIFQLSILFVEFYDPAIALPPHQIVMNAIGDADLCRPSLEAALRILARTSAPVLNPPAKVLLTGRMENARRLAQIPGVITPTISLLPRALLESPDAAALLTAQGFTFPLLLRAPGFHTGRFFVRVENEQALTGSVSAMPSGDMLVISYLDARDSDGKIRKYRVMMIGGVLYPIHVAISHDWKIHYFTAEMMDNPEHRAEDAAFLENMPQTLGPKVMQVLEAICNMLGLDYGGIDFSLNAQGDVLLFEANATMVVHPPDKDPRWDYRRPAVQRVLDAIRRLLTEPPLEALLTSGGDARITPGPDGTNKYGCLPTPHPEILSYSSSTASTISARGFSAVRQLYLRLQEASRLEPPAVTYAKELDRIRAEFLQLCDLDALEGIDVVFGASGTDLHLFAAQLLRSTDMPLLVIMPEPSETGSGVGAALQGRHFSTRTAHADTVNLHTALDAPGAVEVRSISSREPNGNLRPEARVDSEVEKLAADAIAEGRHVLLVMTDVSKTGLITPSPACVLSLRERFAAHIDILIDACQFRLTGTTLRGYLEQDCMIAVTGSKFVTGPAFCGALLIPPAIAQRLSSRSLPAALRAYCARAEWPKQWAAPNALNEVENYGLLLRWEAALAELRVFCALPQARIRSFLESIAAIIQERLEQETVFEPLPVAVMNRKPLPDAQTWDQVTTIFPFLLRHHESGALFTRKETQQRYEALRKENCMLGQPVECGVREKIGVSALRLNIDMRHITDALAGRGEDAVIADTLHVLDMTAKLSHTLS